MVPKTPPFAFDIGEQGLAGVGDILAEHADALVVSHQLAEGEAYRLPESDGLTDALWRGIERVDARDGVDMVGDGGRIGLRGSERVLGRCGHLVEGLLLDRIGLVGGQDCRFDQLSAHADDRASPSLLFELLT